MVKLCVVLKNSMNLYSNVFYNYYFYNNNNVNYLQSLTA